MRSLERPELPALFRTAAHPLRWALLTALARGDHRVRELVDLVGEPQNLVSYHLRQLRSAGFVGTRRSTFDGRDTYYRLDLSRCAAAFGAAAAALHPALATSATGHEPTAGSVLFLCTGNSARSPIAAALLRRHCDRRVRIAAAGSHPKPEFHPYTRRILHEDYRIDTVEQRPRSLTTVAGRHFDHVITLCDKVREYPHNIPATTSTHWSTADPATADYLEFRRITTELDTRIRYLLPTLAPHPEEPA